MSAAHRVPSKTTSSYPPGTPISDVCNDRDRFARIAKSKVLSLAELVSDVISKSGEHPAVVPTQK